MSIKIFLCFFIIIFNFASFDGKKCEKSDIEFKYTECDKTGHRWLVSVPKADVSCDATSNFSVPRHARNCGDPCLAGTFLDIESQECKSCTNGTYSQGNTIDINFWPVMHPGFKTSSLDYSGLVCEKEKWIPKGEFISATVSYCESLLSYTASLYKPGHMTFDYQMTGDSTFFQVKVVHDECQSQATDKSSVRSTVKFMEPSPESSWVTRTIALSKGVNVITWTVAGIDEETSVVKMNNLLITNSIFSSLCINCSAGYFSATMASKCSPCPINTYSDRPGSDQCKPCPPDQYSMAASKSCVPRSACVINDYTYKWTDCDANNRRRQIHLWIEPKFCSESLPGAVKLPSPSVEVECGSCPIGTFLNVSSQRCQFCPSASVSVAGKCVQCSPNTRPVSAFVYEHWTRPLPNVIPVCANNLGSHCNSNDSWLLNGDHLQSSLVSNSHFLRLSFETEHRARQSSKSSFSFQFSLSCTGYCVLHLFLKRDRFSTVKVHTWMNSTSKSEFRSEVPFNTSGRFIWYFAHSVDSKSVQKSTDYVRIYSIKMTNLKNVGAVECRNCDPKFMSTGCLDCDKGKYFSNVSRQCESCPHGHILVNYPSQSVTDCSPCGRGLTSVDGSSCTPNLTYISSSNNVYDLSRLKGHHLLRGNRLFNTHGQEYVHVFNVTLFHDQARHLSLCRNNMSLEDGVMEISSPMCRVTIISDKSQNNTLYAVQTISLAETYQKIEQSNISIGYWKEMNESLAKHGFSGDSSGVDLHLYLVSSRKTGVCANGRVTVVTIRCDSSLTKARFMMPSKCPVETCDGCNFHFLVRGQDGCPYCRMEDFKVITEECVAGRQKRHFKAPSYCVMMPGSPSMIEIKCPLVTMRTAIIVIPTLLVLVFLIGIVIYCYKQNKKLEYKYMSLIASGDDNDQVLEGSQSCAIQDGDDDDEEDNDEVNIKKKSKSGKMFAQFNKPKRAKRYRNDMETINLNDNPAFDI